MKRDVVMALVREGFRDSETGRKKGSPEGAVTRVKDCFRKGIENKNRKIEIANGRRDL